MVVLKAECWVVLTDTSLAARSVESSADLMVSSLVVHLVVQKAASMESKRVVHSAVS